FAETNKDKIYDTVFGPELATELDQAQKFGKHKWSYNDKLLRGATNALSNGSGATYVAQRLWAASAREVEVALGSDDGFQLFLDGKAVAEQRVDRGVALAQDRGKLQLTAGPHLLVLKVCNTGGAGGFAIQHVPGANELQDDLYLAMVPDILGESTGSEATDQGRGTRLLHAYRSHRSPVYRERSAHLEELKAGLAAIATRVPRAMVMQERSMMRE